MAVSAVALLLVMVMVPTVLPPAMMVVGVVAKLMVGTVRAVTVMVSVLLPVPPPLVAVMVAVKVPVTVGDPEITPVTALTPRPAGSPVAPKLVGVLVAAMA